MTSVNKKKLSASIEKYEPKLTEKQRLAIGSSINNNFTAILGPEGSGKKTVLTCTLDILRKNYPRSHIEVLTPGDESVDLKSQIEQIAGSSTPSITSLSHVNFTSLSRFAGKEIPHTKKQTQKPPNIVVIYGAERLDIDTWNDFFTSSRLFSLTKLIFIGDTDLEFFGKSHNLWHMLASGKTKVCTVRLDDHIPSDSPVISAARAILDCKALPESTGNIEVKFIGRDQTIWRNVIQEHIISYAPQSRNTAIFVPNRRYKTKLNRLCQQKWNYSELDVECSLIRSGEVTIHSPSDVTPQFSSPNTSPPIRPAVESGEEVTPDDVPDTEKDRKEDKDRVRVEFNAERRMKRLRLQDRVIWKNSSLPNFPVSDGTLG